MIPVPSSDPVIEPNFIGMPLDLSSLPLPSSLRLGDTVYEKKQEHHLTLVGRGHDLVSKIAVARGLASDKAALVAMQYCRLMSRGIRFTVTIEPHFYRVEKEYAVPAPHLRGSVIALCSVDMSEDLYEALTIMFRMPIEPPPFHVTLYTLGDEQSRKGIGIASDEEFERHAKEIRDPTIFGALAAIR